MQQRHSFYFSPQLSQTTNQVCKLVPLTPPAMLSVVVSKGLVRCMMAARVNKKHTLHTIALQVTIAILCEICGVNRTPRSRHLSFFIALKIYLFTSTPNFSGHRANRSGSSCFLLFAFALHGPNRSRRPRLSSRTVRRRQLRRQLGLQGYQRPTGGPAVDRTHGACEVIV